MIKVGISNIPGIYNKDILFHFTCMFNAFSLSCSVEISVSQVSFFGWGEGGLTKLIYNFPDLFDIELGTQYLSHKSEICMCSAK